MRAGVLVVDDVPDPVPGQGQLLVRTLVCGICGSDLHFLRHAEKMVELSSEMGDTSQLDIRRLDLSQDIVMGHEFSAEVLEIGPGTEGASVAVGDVVVSMPVMLPPSFDLSNPAGIEPIGAYSNRYPGGYGELMLLSALLAMKVPEGVDARHAALTEPMAVGAHAVNRSEVQPGEAGLVLGAGPVGLAVVSALSRKGIEPIIAADFSPMRREMALRMGAHEATDPRTEPALEVWRRIDGMRPPVIFEAVGVPGMLDQAMRDAPRSGRILIVGACMETDKVRPIIGIGKELTITFSLGYDPFEFSSTLTDISEGNLEVAPLITGEVGINGVPQAFAELEHPDHHCKILVEPALDSGFEA